MHLYRCFFVDKDGHIKAAEIIEAGAVGEAIESALAMLRERPHHRAIELWDGARRLYPTDEPEHPTRAENG